MKTGRPAKDQEQIRETVKHIRYSAEEWARVEAKVAASGLSYSEFIRRASFQVSITPIDIDSIRELRDTRNELSRIGNNINTIARHASSIICAEDYDYFLKELRSCRDIANALKEELDKISATLL